MNRVAERGRAADGVARREKPAEGKITSGGKKTAGGAKTAGRRALGALFAALAAWTPAGPAAGAGDDFLAMPENPEFSIGPDGNFIVDGHPRFLVGNIYYGYGKRELEPGAGYTPEFAWLYETPPDGAYLRKAGFDSSGTTTSCSWMGKYRDPRRCWQARRGTDWDVMDGVWKSGLPMIVDFTAADWAHGGISHAKGKEPSERAFVKGCHMMSYSLLSPEGRAIWRDMWRAGAEELKEHGAKPYAYELFNEPRYDDRSEYARKVFAARLEKRWRGDAAAMDRAWGSSYGSFEAAAAFARPEENAGLGVEWLKFREEAFVSGVRLGIKTIREVDPDAKFCFQPLQNIVDVASVAAAYPLCEITMAPTGGGSFYETMLLRAVSDGKPIVDGETYLGSTRASHRSKILEEWARGLNASYYFKWERRMGEVDPAKPIESLDRLARRFPWLGLNPRYMHPSALEGLFDAKRDIYAMQDLFASRERGVPAAKRAAVLFSPSNERLAIARGDKCRAFAETDAVALARDAHVPADAVFEGQIAEGRLDRYRFLMASGIETIAPAALDGIEKWVEKGGTLVLAQETMESGEYGKPSAKAKRFPGASAGADAPAKTEQFSFMGKTWRAVPYKSPSYETGALWRTLAAFPGGHPAVSRRPCGKGFVYHVAARFAEPGDGGRLAAAIAAGCGIAPTCETPDPATGRPVDGIEVHAARAKNGATGFFVSNKTLAPVAIRFVPAPEFASPVLADVSRRAILGRDRDGATILLLKPSEPAILRGAPSRSELEKALAGAPSPWNAGTRKGTFIEENYEDNLSRIKEFLAPPPGATPYFSPEQGRVKFLDLRGAADANLGKLYSNPPTGTENCAGVPFGFIRPDQNGDRSCIVLEGAASARIPAGLDAERLWFLHAADGLEAGKPPFSYVVTYSDSTTRAIAIEPWGGVRGREPAKDAPPPVSLECARGWFDNAGRTLWTMEWTNPDPWKTIESIEIVRAPGGAAPVVAAISAETTDKDFGSAEIAPPAFVRAWSGVKARTEGSAVEADFGDSKGWSGFAIKWDEPFPVPAGAKSADIVFDIVSLDGGALPKFQSCLGKNPHHPLEPLARKAGDGRWRVSLPLSFARGADGVRGIDVQRRGEPQGAGEGKKFRIEGFRAVWRGAAENPLALRLLLPSAADNASAVMHDGGMEFAVSEKTESWCSLRLGMSEPPDAAVIPADGELVFEVNSGRTPQGLFGKGGVRVRAALAFENEDRHEERLWLDEREREIEGGRIDDDPWTWQTVRMPLGGGLPQGAKKLKRMLIQLCGLPEDGRCGVVFRNFRLEPRRSGMERPPERK